MQWSAKKAIAQKIHEKEAGYVPSLKGNQGALNDDVKLFLTTEAAKKSESAIEDKYEEVDKGHGRIEIRKCVVTTQHLHETRTLLQLESTSLRCWPNRASKRAVEQAAR
jgi:predicted transposase YbfD/YdcC